MLSMPRPCANTWLRPAPELLREPLDAALPPTLPPPKRGDSPTFGMLGLAVQVARLCTSGYSGAVLMSWSMRLSSWTRSLISRCTKLRCCCPLPCRSISSRNCPGDGGSDA